MSSNHVVLAKNNTRSFLINLGLDWLLFLKLVDVCVILSTYSILHTIVHTFGWVEELTVLESCHKA